MRASMTTELRSHPPAPPVLYTDDDARWEAVKRRDQKADGAFFYSVKTTGVYCRPSCPGRLPLRENVDFHSSADEAERAGFRPCKCCRPQSASIPERVTRLDWIAIAAELDAQGRAVI
ncbi:MAG: methylphosphotriester-DNA--protein-cysteine methyltransferase family protein, partial [Bradyrhizobiaceae bacterium]|nr:methylphosphotriester-DNA--protein-cysteine methyltransferase family protein [Bradyrhizobiaceae bacterium]